MKVRPSQSGASRPVRPPLARVGAATRPGLCRQALMVYPCFFFKSGALLIRQAVYSYSLRGVQPVVVRRDHFGGAGGSPGRGKKNGRKTNK